MTPEKETVVFLMYHGRGHFHAVSRIAQILSKTCRVVFVGHLYFRNDVIDQGFEFYGLKSVPFALGFEPWVNQMEKKKNIYWHSLRDRWTNRLFNTRLQELKPLIEKLKPKTIFIDSWQSTDFVVLYPLLRSLKIKTAFIQTMLPTSDNYMAPLNSGVLPENANEIKAARKTFWRTVWWRNVRQTVRYFGKTNRALLHAAMKANKIPERSFPKTIALFSPAFTGIDEFVLAPPEFQFAPYESRPWQHYIGFMPDVRRSEKTNEAFEIFFRQVSRRLQSENLRLIYCSFGTVQYDDVRDVKKFVANLVQVIASEEWFCIISCNDDRIMNSFADVSDKVGVFKSVPQLKILSQASLFISHGGINSIKEAIYLGVPLLVYPLSADVDHRGNAARVLYHRLGLRGDLRTDDEAALRSKMNELISNPVYHQNLRSFRQVDEKYTEENFLKLFHSLHFLE
jgi:zeaxanthin glucosyltransferase